MPGMTHETSMPVPRSSKRDGLAVADDAVLGRAVGGAAREAALAGDGRDVDDVAGAARLEAADGLLGAVDDGVEVELELAGDRRVGLLVGRRDSGMMPALLMSTSSGPSSASTSSRKAVKRGAVGDVEAAGDRAAAELRGGALRRVEVDVADRDARALGDQRLGGGGADAAPASGDDDDLP